MKKNIKITFILFILFLSDITSKYFILNKLPDSGIYFFKNFELAFYKNYGVAFGITINRYIIVVMSFMIIIILINYLQKYLKEKQFLLSFFIGLISIGAISNFMDRIIYNYIVDFISIWILPIFNLADLYITTGIIAIIFLYKKSPTKSEGSNIQ